MSSKKLRLAFMGTPDFALPTLKALMGCGHEVVMVYAQPPQGSGRGLRSRDGVIADFARQHKLPLRQMASLRTQEEKDFFASLNIDAAIIAAFGLILPKEFLSLPRLGCLNLHPSMLPLWRGAAPIERAIMAGDQQTGITIMLMDEGVDSGDILAQEKIAMGDMNAGQLREVMAQKGASLMAATLEDFANGKIKPQKQDDRRATSAPCLTAEDEKIHWQKPALEILCQIRALSPRPGAWFEIDARSHGEPTRIRLLDAALADGVKGAAGRERRRGQVLDEKQAIIACGSGAVRLLKLQRAGKKIMDIDVFLLGFPLNREMKLN